MLPTNTTLNSNLAILTNPILVGSAKASSSSWATIINANSKIKNNIICEVIIGDNIISTNIPKIDTNISDAIYFRIGNASCDVRVAYFGTVNNGQFQVTNATVDGVDYKTNDLLELFIYSY